MKHLYALAMALTALPPATAQQPSLGGWTHSTAPTPWLVAASDVDGDGLSDLVTSHVSPVSSLYLATQLAGGGFSEAQKIVDLWPTSLLFPSFLSLVDLDDDGDLDILAPPTGVLRGDGTGSFGPLEVMSALVGSSWPECYPPGDVTGDGRLDIVVLLWPAVLQQPPMTELVTLVGQPDGSFISTTPQTLAPWVYSQDPVFADLDGDGLIDIVGKGFSSSTGWIDTVMFMRGHGDGTFETAIPGTTIQPPPTGPLIAADLDGDGDIDLAHGNGPGWSVQVLVNDGQGSFSLGEETQLPDVGAVTLGLETGDFDGDGLPDVIATELHSEGIGHIWLLTGDGAGGFASLSTAAGTMPSINGGFVTEANDDGRDDFLLAHAGNAALSLFFGSPDAFVDVGYGSGPARLSAAGSTAVGELISLQVTGVPTGTPGFIALSLATSATPLAGGTLLPASPLLVSVIAASPLQARWPAILFDGTPVYAQALMPGYPPSNGLALIDGTEP